MKLKIILILVAAIFVSSCSSRKHVVKDKQVQSTEKPEKKEVVIKKESKKKTTPPKKNIVYSDIKLAYIAKYSDIAMDEMRKYKIPASITLAQGILESRSGQSTLTKKSNNHFGIKCHRGWTGGKTYHDDDEKGECFRVYKHPEKSFKDHSLFLAERTRYAGLFNLKITDYKGWAKGLKKAGYATDPGYPKKLITIIEQYELYDYDDMVLGKKKRRKKKDEPTAYTIGDKVIVRKGESLYSIAKKNDLTVRELKKLNGLKSNDLSIGQELIVVKGDKKKEVAKSTSRSNESVSAKNKNGSKPQIQHSSVVYVKKGETLYSISKQNGITVDELKELNGITSNNLTIGQELIVKKTTRNKNKESIVVEKGDTLYSIAKRYGLTVNELKDMNDLSGSTLSVGQELKVFK